MLAPREIPERYAAWNREWGAPFGHRLRSVSGLLPASVVDQIPVAARARAFGPFGFMWNATTRRFEYPWTYFAIDPWPGRRVLEIGGGISGLQFVLAKRGCEVHNVDPFLDFGKGSEAQARRVPLHEELNHAFGTTVVLHRSTLAEAGLEGPFDVVYSVSTIEHIPAEELEQTLRGIASLLAPGGSLVVTVDLFLNLVPFCAATTNQWGTNVSIRWIEEVTGLALEEGDRSRLYGYDEFSAEGVLTDLATYNLNTGYPELVQCAVFRAG